MIPAPVPIAPLVVLISAAILVFAYASVKAGTGYFKNDTAAPHRRTGALVSVCSGVLGVAAAIFLVTILATHQASYDRIVWKTLGADYGISAAVDQQGFTSGVPFAALLDGKDAICTVSLPSSVICDGVMIPRAP